MTKRLLGSGKDKGHRTRTATLPFVSLFLCGWNFPDAALEERKAPAALVAAIRDARLKRIVLRELDLDGLLHIHFDVLADVGLDEIRIALDIPRGEDGELPHPACAVRVTADLHDRRLHDALIRNNRNAWRFVFRHEEPRRGRGNRTATRVRIIA